ncbi:amino acid adenylation domain-containing protein [Alcaligenaceae bacterium C4P045]|nr:amino acid adenylation domain-containing protein [Alcaligenaceae bacterium C4P045]
MTQRLTAPLTEAQAGMWFAQRLDAGNPIFNTAQRTDIEGDLDIDAFTWAVDTAMDECDSLALRVVDIDGVPHGVVDPAMRPRLQMIDVSLDADPHARARTLMAADMQRPADPAHDPMAAQWLLRTGPASHIWYQRVHHLAADGYGMALIDARVAQLYRSRVTGEGPGSPLAPLANVMDESAAYLASEKRVADRAYWLDALAGGEPAIGLAEGVPLTAHRFLQAGVALSDRFAAQLASLAQRSGASWPDILLGLSAVYVARMTGRTRAVVGAPYMGRLGSASARVPAMVMNVLPVAIEVDERQPMAAFMLDTSRALRRARRHGRYRSEQLRRDLGLLGGQRRLFGPLINVLPFDNPPALTGLRTRVQVMCAGPVDDLTLTFRGDAAGQHIHLAVEANPALYSQSDVDAHLARLADLLQHAVAADCLADVPTLTAVELTQWQRDAHGDVRAVPRTTLAALLDDALRTHASSDAVVFERSTLTYAELDARSRLLARTLAGQGVGRGDVVALALPRSIELIVALVAIMRAGAAYLPLDLAHPRDRLAAILTSASPRAVLTLHSVRDVVPCDSALCVDTILSGEPATRLGATAAAAAHSVAPAAAVTMFGTAPATTLAVAEPDDPAYVIYTSGSTGAPKGVVVAHDAIVNRLLWMGEHYGFGPACRTLQKTPATFDVSVWEFFLPLITGGVLVVAPPEAHKDPAWLADIVRTQRIDTLHFVPSMLSAFLAEPSAKGLHLKRVFCSGEALPAAVRDRFHQVFTAELHNLYGPTEAAVDVSYWPAAAHDPSVPVPIGYPVWNTALYVLDDCLRPLPVGVAGHLYIAGRQLAQGYLGRPDLTAERFVADPFGAEGARMYVTGDLARRRADGALVFLGRSDHQIKIRGQRIELEEIEAVLAHAPGVSQVAVIVRTDQPGQDRIVAYAVAHDHAVLARDALRTHATQRLPDYMVPAAFVILPALPITANGKLDRRALPQPPQTVSVGRAPNTPTERAVAEMFAAVLGHAVAVQGADDDFFELGGHSLLAAQLASAIRQRWGYAFSLGAVFEHPTVARMAQHLDALSTLAGDDQARAASAGGFGAVIGLRHGPAERPALFCVHPAGGLSWCYGALARALSPDRTVYGLQARGLHPDCPDAPESIAAMASEYVDALLALQPAGPYHLAGWSVGGIIVQAMAAELHRRGHPVGALAMLDAYPCDVWRDQPAPPADAIYKALLHIAGYDPAGLIDLAMTRDGVVDFLRRSGHPLGELPDDMIDGVFRVVAENNTMVRAHHHTVYPGHLMYFRAALDHEGENLFPRQWSPYVASLDIHEIPSVHAHMVGADATALIAPLLAAHLDACDRATTLTSSLFDDR